MDELNWMDWKVDGLNWMDWKVDGLESGWIRRWMD